MNPSEQEPDNVNTIADQNTERLLAGAYRPEMPDPAFLARVTAAMHVAAVEGNRPAPRAGLSSSVIRKALDRLDGRGGAALGRGGVSRSDLPSACGCRHAE